MAKPIGTAGTAPRTVNKKPKARHDVPIRSADHGTSYPKATPPPRPSFARPLAPAFPTRVVPRPKRLPNPLIVPHARGGIPSTPRATSQAEARRARRAALQQKVSFGRTQVRQQLGTFIGPMPNQNRLHDSIFHRPAPAAQTRLLNYPDTAGLSVRSHGVVISPQQTMQQIANLFAPGTQGKQTVLEYLHRAGIVDPRGTTTHRELVAAQRQAASQYRKQLLSQLWSLQNAQNQNGSNLAVPKYEFDRWIGRMPTSELEARLNQQALPKNLQRMGIDPGALGGLITGTVNGISDLFDQATPNTFLGRAAHDALMFPTWAVPAAYSAATNPGEFAKGLTQGVIGHLARGDVSGAERVFSQHPLYSVAEVRGATALGGRLSAAGIRGGAQIGRRVGLTDAVPLSTAREPINLTGLVGSRLAQERTGTKGLVLPRVRQRLVDAALTKRGPAIDREGHGRTPARVYRTDLPGIGPVLDAARKHQIVRHQDYGSSRGISYEQLVRDEAARDAHNARLPNTRLAAVQRLLDIPSRPATSAGYHGVLGKIAARVAPHLALDPVADIVSFAARGVIRSVIKDEHGNIVGPATARSVAEDLDHLIHDVRGRLQQADPQALVKPENRRAAEMLQFLQGVRQSRDALEQVHRVVQRLAPEFARSDRDLTRLGALDPAAAERAPLFPAAMTRLGAEYGKTEEASFAHQERIDTLKAARAQAKQHVGRAETPMELEAAQAGLRAVNNDLRRAYKARQAMGLRSSTGEVLTNDQIRAGLAKTGIDPSQIFHLPHQSLGGGAYHKMQTLSRRNADTHALTGSMWQKGQSAYSWDHVVDSLVHSRTLAANIQTLDQNIHDVGTKVGNGSWDAATSFVKKAGEDANGNPRYVALRRMSSRLDPQRRLVVDEHQKPLEMGQADEQLLTHSMLTERATPPAKDGPDVAVVVPYEWFARAEKNVKSGASTPAALQAISSAFRQTVLPFSTKWLFGNVAEAVLRTVAVTTNPLDRRVARVALDRMIAEDALALYGHDPAVRARANALIQTRKGHLGNPIQARRLRQELIEYAPRARAVEAELTGGLLYGHRGQSVRRTAAEMGPVGRSVAAIGKLPPINEFVGMTRWIAQKSFAFNRMLEREAQYMALGKHVRNEVQAFSGDWMSGVKLHEKAIADFSKGLLGTPAQLKAANWLDETLGRYSRFNPNTRWAIQNLMPFLPWTLNAVRWTMWTIPGKHPIKTALLTSAERTFEQDWSNQHSDKLTRHGELATYPAAKDGGFLPLTHYTPFGLLGPILGGGDPKGLPGLVMPQYQGALNALAGQDAFNNPLMIPKKYGGTGEQLQGGDLWKIAANQLIESLVPGVQIARRLREKGSTGLPTSTLLHPQVKPGSSHGQSALERIFEPWREVILRNNSTDSYLPAEVKKTLDDALKNVPSGAGLPDDIKKTLDEALQGAG